MFERSFAPLWVFPRKPSYAKITQCHTPKHSSHEELLNSSAHFSNRFSHENFFVIKNFWALSHQWNFLLHLIRASRRAQSIVISSVQNTTFISWNTIPTRKAASQSTIRYAQKERSFFRCRLRNISIIRRSTECWIGSLSRVLWRWTMLLWVFSKIFSYFSLFSERNPKLHQP